MNYNLSMSVNTSQQFHQVAKLGVNGHFLNQTLAPRFIGMQNLGCSGALIANSMSPPSQHNKSLKANPLSHPSSNLNESYNMQRGFIAPNLVSQVNLNQYAQNTQNNLQKANTQSLIASVVAANTSCNLNNTLFVGNLHASLQEVDLVQVFRPFGQIVECCKKWLHFGFVKFTSEEEACHAYVTLNGFRLKGRPMRLEFQNRTKKVNFSLKLSYFKELI